MKFNTVEEAELHREATKQDRLKQVIHEVISPYLIRGIRGGFETAILGALSEEGVVIKVDRELPYRLLVVTRSPQNAYEQAERDMLKAGYVAVEPLMKEKV